MTIELLSRPSPVVQARGPPATPQRARPGRFLDRRDHGGARERLGHEGRAASADQEGAHAARQDPGHAVLRGQHAHARRLRGGGQGARRRHGQRLVVDQLGDQGRVADRHHPHAASARRRLRRHAPPPGGRAVRGGRRGVRVGDQRRRRLARAPDPGAARPVHDSRTPRPHRRTAGGDRRRHPAQPCGALEPVGSDAHGRERRAVWPADPAARRRVVRRPALDRRPHLPPARSAGRRRRHHGACACSSNVRPADCSRACAST